MVGHAQLGPTSRGNDGCDRGSPRINGDEWATLDLQDGPPLGQRPELAEWRGIEEPIERKQCILLSAAAATLWAREGKEPALTQAQGLALQGRWEMHQQALAAQEVLQDPRTQDAAGGG